MSLKGYLFWDSETANPQQMICQAAYCLTGVDGSPVGAPISSLVNPESEFSPWNTKVHGICEEDVCGAPTFAEFWESQGLDLLLRDHVFVAHNAKSADLCHIRKSLAAYGIALPGIRFLDTMRMAQAQGLPGKLTALCSALEVELPKHHDACSDATACRDVFWKLAATGMRPEEYIPGRR